MKLPIFAYGQPILRQPAKTINENLPGLARLIENMWDTMYNANGCGLAAPQVGQPLKLFIVDSKTTYDNLETSDRKYYFSNDDQGITETFINAKIIERSGNVWVDNEGCLSIPGITQEIARSWEITVEYYDKRFEKHSRTFNGATARMIQHEHDHIEGVLFLDYLKPLSMKLLDRKLKNIIKGKISVKYPMKFP